MIAPRSTFQAEAEAEDEVECEAETETETKLNIISLSAQSDERCVLAEIEMKIAIENATVQNGRGGKRREREVGRKERGGHCRLALRMH